MPTSYSLALRNTTPRSWIFVVFITLPGGAGLDSVAWRLRAVPTSGTGSLPWIDELCVAIGTRTVTDGIVVYSDTQAKSTTVDEAWEIELAGGAQQLVAAGRPITPGTVQVTNASGQLANAALGVDGTGAVYAADLYSGARAVFRPPPRYYVLLADAMVPGQLITQGDHLAVDRELAATTVIVGPEPLDLSPANSSLTVTAKLAGASIEIEVTSG
jgi:hypothetical protein